MGYNGCFDNDFKEANELGLLLIAAIEGKLKQGARLIQTESLNESVARMMDMYSGVDGMMLYDDSLSGVAFRIQNHSDKNWGTFTIRYSRSSGSETEYNKRIKQIYGNHPSFYPHYTCQAYFNTQKELIGGAFCLTKSLFDVARKYEPFKDRSDVYLQENMSDGNSFIVVPFNMVKPIVLF
jgi:hypothetical protein